MKSIILFIFSLFLSVLCHSQIQSFFQLRQLVKNENRISKELVKFVGYQYDNVSDILPNMKCSTYLYMGDFKAKNAVCFCKYLDEYPVCFYVDSTFSFLRNTILEVEKMGYSHISNERGEYYEKGESFLFIFKQNGMFGYWFSLDKKAIALMSLLGH